MKTIKMIAALMLMTITAATPATAKNKKVSHFDRVEMKHEVLKHGKLIKKERA